MLGLSPPRIFQFQCSVGPTAMGDLSALFNHVLRAIRGYTSLSPLATASPPTKVTSFLSPIVLAFLTGLKKSETTV